jgi:hypothetical protein
MAPGFVLSPRWKAEETWLEKLRQAGERYRLAMAECRLIQGEYRSMPSSDGNFALQEALRIENQCRAEYKKVLNTFHRLILYGEPPDEAEGTETK